MPDHAESALRIVGEFLAPLLFIKSLMAHKTDLINHNYVCQQ